MAEEMEERARKVVGATLALTEEGGIEAVRLRDVDSHAGVALGTLYRRFRSKEDLLVAVLERESSGLERRFCQHPPKGADELERVIGFFALATKGLLRRPNLARAWLKAAASGEPELAQKVASFHASVARMIVMSLRGEVTLEGEDLALHDSTIRERTIADTLDLMWFALLVGWSGGIHDLAAIMDRMRTSAELVLRGSVEIQ